MTDKPTYSSECWSLNDEDYHWRDLADLLSDHDDLKPGDTVYKGVASNPDPAGYVAANDVIELLNERAYDEGGEYVDGWPQVSNEGQEQLNQLLKAWVNEHCPTPDFYRVLSSAPYVLTAADFEA